MPQGKRKTPFSGKRKKIQIGEKRQNKKIFPRYAKDDSDSNDDGKSNTIADTIQKINYQSSSSGRGKANRYALQFHRESDHQLKEMKEDSRRTLVFLTKEELETGSDFFHNFDFPIRPKWTYSMSKQQLERTENQYFTEYIMKLEKQHIDENRQLSYCELNLETWRQLWRVLEICDILLIIADVRYPTLMFPPSLFEYVTNELGKHIILVLNKIDISPAPVVLAWKKYFETKYKNINVVLFTSFPGYNLRKVTSAATKGLQIRRRRGKMRMAIEGAQQVYRACRHIVQDAVDLSNWEQKISEENKAIDDEEDDEPTKYERTHDEEPDFLFEEHVLYKNGILTIGCVGFPNVGKSSLLNALMGRKVVSVSKTPGHTKHFQTIFLTNTVRLCDCPGLVFPSSAPRKLQVLLGSYPIAQLRVPIASVKYLAERLNLIRILNIHHPEGPDGEWSAIAICEAWAVKRGFFTTKAARPDTSRAANSILRMALEGQISLSLMPPDYNKTEDFWKNHEELKEVEAIQALGKVEDYDKADVLDDIASNSDEDDSDNAKASEHESDDNNFVPVMQNAFSLLNTE